MSPVLRNIWLRLFRKEWIAGLSLVLLFGITRFIVVLNTNVTGSYQYTSIIFMIMWVTPWIFLSGSGRRYSGFQKPRNWMWLLYSLAAGILFCTIMYAGATLLFGHTISNSFVYISGSQAVTDKAFIFFAIMALIGMTFSPIGEEFLYRGVIHSCFAIQEGDRKASILDSLAFAVTHLAHFGIIYHMGEWSFLPVPALLWVLCMFLVSRLFFLCRQKTGSILGAILCHAGYNLAMMYFIFYHIL